MKNNPRRREENYVIKLISTLQKLQFKKIIIVVIYKKENIDVAIKVRETNLQSMK